MADLKKKNFWISRFFTPKMGKNLVLGALLPGAKRGCAPTAPAKIFWSVHPNISRNNISKIQYKVFPYFWENSIFPFWTFFPRFIYVLTPPSGCVCCSGNLFLVKSDRGQPKLSFDTPNIDIRWLLHHEKAWYILICSITSCKVMKYQVEAM